MSCHQTETSKPEVPTKAQKDTAVAIYSPTFIGRKWRVTSSPTIAKDQTYFFRSDGILEIKTPGSTTAYGKWSYRSDSLHIIEEGQVYPVDILRLTDTSFVVSVQNPGTPTLIEMAPVAE